MRYPSGKLHFIWSENVGPAWEFYFPACNTVMAWKYDDPRLTRVPSEVTCKNCQRVQSRNRKSSQEP